MKCHRGQIIIILAWLVVYSCTLFEKNFDNPVDFEANEEKGIGAPTLVFYPKSQTKTISDSVIVGSFIVFKEDSMEAFSGVHLQIIFPDSFLELDTIKPGLFITDTSNSMPLFTYTFDSVNTIDIYAYFLDTLKTDLIGTGHLADLVFNPTNTGSDSVRYHLNACEMIDHEDSVIILKGDRGAEVIIQ
tara:strand:- start:409 stop:972 length:564 start_codon:yes stop_codon:yes gene_type:complete